MKKLMIAATAAMAGATTFGGLCDPDAAGPDSCSVYNIKFTFKTLAAKTACAQGAKWLVTDVIPGRPGLPGAAVWYRNSNADELAKVAAGARSVRPADYVGVANACATAGLIQNASLRQVFWMDNATRKFEGIAWQCRFACFEGVFADCDLTNNGRLNYVLWEKKNSLALTFPIFQIKLGETNAGAFVTDTLRTEYFSQDAQNVMIIGRYGNKAQKVAAYWQPRLLRGQTIDAAGFGTYDAKNLRTKSLSGNAVGLLAPVDVGTDPCGRVRIFCALGFMCVEWLDWCCDGCYAGVELVPASGTWSLKYNASATKKANKDKATLADFVPAYMFYSNAAWAFARNLDPFLHTDNYYWWDLTNGTLFYKKPDGESAAAELTEDDILDSVADGACNVIGIALDGVPMVDEDGKVTGYKYDDKEYTLEGGVLPESVFTEDDENE